MRYINHHNISCVVQLWTSENRGGIIGIKSQLVGNNMPEIVFQRKTYINFMELEIKKSMH